MFALTKILKCNIGEKFDINKLYYKKIIIMADSDADGFNITSLVSAFFLYHLRPIVEAGLLYKAVAPLYRIKSKYKEFILDKREYTQVFERQIRDNIILKEPKSDNAIKDKDLEDILYINRDYLEELMRTATHVAIDPLLLEFIIMYRKDKDFMKKFKKKYPEITIDEENVLSGVLNNHYQILIMDKLFDKRIKKLEEYIFDINHGKMYYHVFEKYNKDIIDKGIMTLGQFLMMAQKFQPPIITRFKGLGELDPKDLCATTMDPNNRILIRLTIGDIEKDLRQFAILHGDESDERKLMMQAFKINREDLDN